MSAPRITELLERCIDRAAEVGDEDALNALLDIHNDQPQRVCVSWKYQRPDPVARIADRVWNELTA